MFVISLNAPDVKVAVPSVIELPSILPLESIFPFTSSLSVGLLVPIPKYESRIDILSIVSSSKYSLPAFAPKPNHSLLDVAS